MPLPVDNEKAFQYVRAQIEAAVKYGKLDREKAGQVLKGAKKNYAKNNLNRIRDNQRRKD